VDERAYRKFLLLVGHGVFLVLGVLAWQYAFLRTTYADSAFQIFQWISQPGWDIEAHRYTAIVPQALVKLFAVLGSDLRTLLRVASLAHVGVGYAVFALCAHVWRAPVAAIGCALAAVLCSRFTFYSPVLEANYLLCYPFLLFGFLEHRGKTGGWAWYHPVFAVLLLLVPLIVHPVGWMVMVFGLVFCWLSRGVPLKALIPLLVMAAGWPLIGRAVFPPTAYELGHYAAVSSGLATLPSLLQWGSWRYLSIHTFDASNTYLPALLVWLAIVVGWCALRQWWTALLAFTGTLAFLLVYLITFHAGDSGIMMDRGILPVATVLALSGVPLLFRAKGPRIRAALTVLVVLVLAVKLRDVSFASRPYRERQQVITTLLAEAEQQGLVRAIVPVERFTERGVELNWALPCESLLLSSLNGASAGRILVAADQVPHGQAAERGALVLFDRVFSLTQKSERYFQPTNSPYVPLGK
jgi:hypothetical protein